MSHSSATAPLKALSLLATSGVAANAVLVLVRPLLGGPARTFDQSLTVAAAWLLLAGAGWAVLICAAAVLETLTAGRLQATTWICPTPVRRALLAGLGAALVTSTAGPGWAQVAPEGSTVRARNHAEATIGKQTSGPRIARSLPVPSRPTDRAGPRTVDVRAGDTLWGLVARRLPRPTSPGEIAHLVDLTHRRNHEVIGTDPDLIRPGQRLLLPPVPASHRHREEKS